MNEINYYMNKHIPTISKNLKEHIIDLSFEFIIKSRKFTGDVSFVKYFQHVSDCLERETINYIEGLEVKEFVERFHYFPIWV